jgi:carboxyl-terminal processing protease
MKPYIAAGVALSCAISGLFTLAAQSTPAERRLNLESFEAVWTTIRDKHWDKTPGGLDWQAIHSEYQPRVANAKSSEEARSAMREMLGRLHETHFAILSGNVYDSVQDDAEGPGSAGIDIRVLNAEAVVTSVDPGSPAERAGVRPGWTVESVNGNALTATIQRLSGDAALSELNRTRAVLARVSGEIGGKLAVTFFNGSNTPLPLQLDLVAARGTPVSFGNLPNQHVWYESKKIGRTGYVRFNMFLDVVRLMNSFAKSVSECQDCDGLVIDVRGNPGGLGAMAMGMAGYLVDKLGLRLGTMYMRDSALNFVINPRQPGFSGPVAILIDGDSASTSEIFAGGLKDIGRARIFGTRSAGAALPSLIERLPNGDGFQYAIANYISEGGKPLEGSGVQPDVEVKLTREALLDGHDPVIDAALEWIGGKRIP